MKRSYSGRGRYNLLKSSGGFFKRLGNIGLGALEKKMSGRGLYTGRGSYRGRGSYVQNGLIAGGRPAMSFAGANDETQSITLGHVEYLSDVYGPANTAFNNNSLNLNPGMQEVFPWLSQLAVNYEEYEFIQLIFHFRSTIDSSTAANGQTGTLIQATNYNPDAPAFVSKDQMMTYHGAQSGRLTDDISSGVECDPRKNAGGAIKRIRNKPLDASDDIKDYDLGIFQYAMNNTPSTFANQAVGELWVEYKVKLLKPKISSNRGEAIQTSLFGASATGINAAGPFGPSDKSLLLRSNNMIPFSLTLIGNKTTVVVPASVSGLFELKMFVEGATLASGAFTLSKTGNVNDYVDMYAVSEGGGGDAPSPLCTYVTATNILFVYRFYVKAATGGIDNTIGINHTMTGTVTQAYMSIAESNPSFAVSNSLNCPRWYKVLDGSPGVMD